MFHANETVSDEMLFDSVSLPLEIKVFFLYQWSYNDHISIYQFMVLIKEIKGLFIWRWAGPERWTGSPRWDRTFSKKHLICSYEKKTARLGGISLYFAGITPWWDENFPYEQTKVGQPGKVE